MFILAMLFSMSTTNGLFILQARQDTIKRHIRDIQMEIEENGKRFTYQWMRGINKYKITVYEPAGKNGYRKKYVLIYDGQRLYKFVMDSFVAYPITFYNEINLSLLDWINFIPGQLSWEYKEKEVIVHFKDKKRTGDMFLDRDGRLLRVRFTILGEEIWLRVTKYRKIAGVDGFPVEWTVYIGGEKKTYRVYDIEANKGMCAPCTFKIPRK